MTGTRWGLANLLAECDAHGIRLTLAGNGGLTIDAPHPALTPSLLDRLKAHQGELLQFLDRFQERAAIMEFDGNLMRRDAERLARRDTLQFEQYLIGCEHGPEENEGTPNETSNRPVAASD